MLLIYFTSKKDSIYFIVIWGTALMMTILTIRSGFHPVTTLFGVLTVAFLLWVWFGTGYSIHNETLTIKSGPMKQTINIKEIRSISRQKSIWSAPTLSSKRLGLRYGLYGDVLISPKKEKAFIEELLKRNGEIEIISDLFTSIKDREDH